MEADIEPTNTIWKLMQGQMRVIEADFSDMVGSLLGIKTVSIMALSL